MKQTIVSMLVGCALEILVVGCNAKQPATMFAPADAPNFLEKADGTGDLPDTSCFVVLRSIGRIPHLGGYLTTCDTPEYQGGDCLYLWEGHVDVDRARLDQVLDVGVLFKTGMTFGQWYVAATASEEGADDGYSHYVFRIDRFTPSSGMSFSSLNQTVIDLIPFIRTSAGRVFDHNRVVGLLDSYHLNIDNLWGIDDASVCRTQTPQEPEYIFSYPDFGETLANGPAVAGGKLKISYDGRRLRETQPCMGGEGPVSSTTLMANWMINQDPNRIGASVVERYQESYGYACQGQTPPCITDEVTTPILDLPADAQTLSLWFTCIALGQSDPAGYDSDFGQNYSLQISPGNGPGWVGNLQTKISREGGDPCEGGVALDLGFDYDTWARQRAVLANVCFDVWKQGVTDFDNPDLWRQLDVQLHFRFTPTGASSQYVNNIGRVGNNARYTFDIRELDPFRAYHCPDVPVTTFDQGGEQFVQAQMQFYWSVNGSEIRPAGNDSWFTGDFVDYAANDFRENNCPPNP